MTDLGTLKGLPCSTARSINARRQIVGDWGKCGKVGQGFLWENGSMVDLQDLVPAGSTLRVTRGVWINDRGEIAANAVLPSGERHAVLLIPTDEVISDADLAGQSSIADDSADDSDDLPEINGGGRMKAGHPPQP
jgi:probable HAF family extracellular repeat protein